MALTVIHSFAKACHVSELDQDVISFPTLGHLLAYRDQVRYLDLTKPSRVDKHRSPVRRVKSSRKQTAGGGKGRPRGRHAQRHLGGIRSLRCCKGTQSRRSPFLKSTFRSRQYSEPVARNTKKRLRITRQCSKRRW